MSRIISGKYANSKIRGGFFGLPLYIKDSGQKIPLDVDHVKKIRIVPTNVAVPSAFEIANRYIDIVWKDGKKSRATVLDVDIQNLLRHGLDAE